MFAEHAISKYYTFGRPFSTIVQIYRELY